MKKIVSEDELVTLLHKLVGHDKTVSIGIGDDAAVIDIPANSRLVITTDTVVEDVHFRAGWADSTYIAKKAVLSNISDCAAMGVVPAYALCSLIFPQDSTHTSQVQSIMHNLITEFKSQGITLVGGNISRGATMSISLTLLAVVQTRQTLLTRGGTQSGDVLLITGCLGRSAWELERLERGIQKKAVYLPDSRIAFGQFLSERGLASSCIDISDGLILDLNRLTSARGVGANLYEELIPVASNASLDNALYGGEEYELLFTAQSHMVPQIFEAAEATQTPVSILGSIGKELGVYLIGHAQKRTKLDSKGWDHLSYISP